MARPRTFELESALEDAMNVFWAKGYEGASLPDLLSEMGIARGSLYKAYGDKRALFLDALALYDRTALTPAIDLLRGARDAGAKDPIGTLFASVVDAARHGDRRGCLMCNAAAGPAAEDEEIARTVAAMLRRLTNAFKVAIANETTPGPGEDGAVTQRAQALTTAYVGLRVLARSGAPLATLKQAAAGVVAGASSDPG